MAESKYFPNLTDNDDMASVEPVEEAFSAVESDVNSLITQINEIEEEIGDIDTGLDNIISIQNSLIGG